MSQTGARMSVLACLATVLIGWCAVLPGQAASRPAVPPAASARPGLLSGPGLAPAGREELQDVTATAARNAWATGDVLGTPPKDVMLHWDGTAWAQVPVPHPFENGVAGVSATSTGNAWAVGEHCSNRCAGQSTLILHWNGTAWSRVASPTSHGGLVSSLSDVSASAPGNAWAVGSDCTIASGTCVPLTLRWNGTAWARVPSPAVGISDSLNAVVAASSTNAWAVGTYCTGAACPFGALMLHWNGRAWARMPVPAGPGSHLDDVTATSVSDAWAVGEQCTASCNAFASLILHWNGTRWSKTPSPSPGATNSLFGVSSTAPGNAWAAGFSCTTTGCGVTRTLIAHWNGKTWAQVASPSPGKGVVLDAVAASSASNAWAVGSNCNGFATRCNPVILHWDGKAWTKSQPPG
jgi:hypothetical protein